MLKTEIFDRLELRVYRSRKEMGDSAGKAVIKKINEILRDKKGLRMVFAAAPSQNEMLDYLLRHKDEVEWDRITAFHMDEYIGLETGSPQLFSEFLNQRLFKHVPFKEVHLIKPMNQNEAERYGGLLENDPIDIVCLGIGENGHIAFNDPPVADFSDPESVKIVLLDEACRIQQVNDGCFPHFDQVPERAITLTIPALMGADFLFCVVPGLTKREAVQNTLYQEISIACPASILRTHKNCLLFTDTDSYPGNIASI